jgi:hypothetical protein
MIDYSILGIYIMYIVSKLINKCYWICCFVGQGYIELREMELNLLDL